jgi:hypothetical protein
MLLSASSSRARDLQRSWEVIPGGGSSRCPCDMPISPAPFLLKSFYRDPFVFRPVILLFENHDKFSDGIYCFVLSDISVFKDINQSTFFSRQEHYSSPGNQRITYTLLISFSYRNSTLYILSQEQEFCRPKKCIFRVYPRLWESQLHTHCPRLNKDPDF